jgi:P27 family predicted phage terminase small subunit
MRGGQRRGSGRKPADRLHLVGSRSNRRGQNLPRRPPKRLPLTAEAAAIWPRVVRALEDQGSSDVAYEIAVFLMCEAWAEWRCADRALSTEEITYSSRTPAGGTIIRPHPLVAVRSDAWKRCRAMLGELGLTWSARVRTNAPADPTSDSKDPLADLLGPRD